jgi:mRNA-degrading endonuclease RelE of RelBE toxin-antitoxin system
LPASPNSKKIQRTNRFGRDVRRLPRNIQEEAFKTATALSTDIFQKTLNVRQMTGFRGIYRVVVIRDYRMIFSFDDENLFLLRIGHRREIYRGLEV